MPYCPGFWQVLEGIHTLCQSFDVVVLSLKPHAPLYMSHQQSIPVEQEIVIKLCCNIAFFLTENGSVKNILRLGLSFYRSIKIIITTARNKITREGDFPSDLRRIMNHRTLLWNQPGVCVKFLNFWKSEFLEIYQNMQIESCFLAMTGEITMSAIFIKSVNNSQSGLHSGSNHERQVVTIQKNTTFVML